MTTYVTFGQEHRHIINGKIFNKDCVARFDSADARVGREVAFDLFGRKFCFEYFDNEFDDISMSYFPRGFVDLTQEEISNKKNIDNKS